MRRVETEVLVIGGGATGTGVLRDLAMRGFKAILVEKRDLTHGTTGRYHGLLHSGARYAVSDTATATECIQENHILRRIMPHCLEDTGGFFVVTPSDDLDFVPKFLEGCQKATISAEEISIGQMLREEPLLNPRIVRCFRVPDGAADSFRAAEVNVESARQYGAQVLTYHPVERLLVEGGRVVGAACRDLVKDEDVVIHADMVVNAGGAWAGRIAAGAGLDVPVLCGKGTMVAVNHRVLNTVVNRCRPASDGDILVPAHTVVVIGTTDVKVDDPDRYAIEAWEMRLMLGEGEKVLPGLREMRILRAWAGVRPLYQSAPVTGSDREMSRGHALLDHSARDGMAGIVTITGGKWTTYRLMAQDTVDCVCALLGTQRACRTHQEVLPGHEEVMRRSSVATSEIGGRKHSACRALRMRDPRTTHWLGLPLAHLEEASDQGNLVCECELATRSDVERAIIYGEARTVDDIRRDVRLGMGPCQGGFCTYRAVGVLHALRRPPVEEADVALHDFLRERWKGLRPVMADHQLRQLRLNELIYRDVFNADHLPGAQASRLGS
jgi:glycerol-3-phosphate dehydrogenase